VVFLGTVAQKRWIRDIAEFWETEMPGKRSGQWKRRSNVVNNSTRSRDKTSKGKQAVVIGDREGRFI